MISKHNFKKMGNEITDKIFFISTVSFEERCSGSIINTKSVIDLKNFVFSLLEIEDDKSYYRQQCYDLQKENLSRIKRILGDLYSTPIKGKLSNSENLVQALISLIEKEDRSIILDITCLPKKVFFPIIKYLYNHWISRHEVFIIYTTALNYPHWLSRDPEEVSFIPAFAGQYSSGKRNYWVPILGFEGGLAKKIYEAGNFIDIFPIVGYPTIFVDRILYSNRYIIEKLPKGLNDIIFCPVNDPQETYQTIKSILIQFQNQDTHIILSPLGSKLQSLGCCLMAIKENLPVMYAQPQTYHPKYSEGIGLTYLYKISRTQNCH